MKELNKSIIKIRVELQNAKLKKSGRNKFAGFLYNKSQEMMLKINKIKKEG